MKFLNVMKANNPTSLASEYLSFEEFQRTEDLLYFKQRKRRENSCLKEEHPKDTGLVIPSQVDRKA